MSARRRPGWILGILLACAVIGLVPQELPAEQPGPASTTALPPAAPTPGEDPEFARLVREWTTRPEFLSPFVDHLPVAPGIPTPADILGHHIGAPGTLTYSAQAYDYYRALAASTPRVEVTTIGQTDEGRDILVVFVGSEAAIGDLEHGRRALAQLADPRGLSDAQAREIIATTRPIYFLSGGLHSAETGPPEMLMELAYRLAVEESLLIRRIRESVITAILPVAEPDGRDRYVDWYFKYLVDVAEERNRVPGPPYWGKYVFHDNNRDINYSQVTQRAVLEWYLRWHPPIMHDLHESAAFLYTFSGQPPQNPRLDPLVYAELPWFANFEMAQLTKFGMPGVWTHGFADMWSPGFLTFTASNHNGLARFYETLGNLGATTMTRQITRMPLPGVPDQTSREWYRPMPPYDQVEWSMRNNINYMETAVLSALQLTSQFPDLVLENFYVKSRNSIESGRTESPHGFVIPAGQRDPTRVALLVNLLRRQGIEVGRARRDFESSATRVAAGDFVIKCDQPYGRLARSLLERQVFPDPELRTYDDSAWTMGLMLNVEVRPISDRAILHVASEILQRDWRPSSTITRLASDVALVVPNHGSTHLITLRSRLGELEVRATQRPVIVGAASLPAGSFVIPIRQNGQDVADLVRAQLEPLSLSAFGVRTLPDVPTHAVDLPRLAVFSTWANTQEVGWVRFALDQFGVSFDLIFKERVLQGNLRTDYDVIVIPSHMRGDAQSLVRGLASNGQPLAYARSDQFASLGLYGESPDIRGGIGDDGVKHLQVFVEQGGELITLSRASTLAPAYGITPGVGIDQPSPQFYAPGPIVQAEILTGLHPVVYGYAEALLPVRYANGPLLTVSGLGGEAYVLMRYQGGESGVLSGFMKNPEEIRDRPAVLAVPVGSGRVILFAGNPAYRWQNHGELGMLFNAVMHWNDRPAGSRRPTRVRVEE